MISPSSSPRLAKRIKVERETVGSDEAPSGLSNLESEEDKAEYMEGVHPEGNDESEDNCSICLHPVVDRTVIPKCSHEFCFECLLVWTEQSRRCPLCSQTIGDYLIHSIRSRYDYRKHFLPPLRTSPPPAQPSHNTAILQTTRQSARRRRREREWGTRDRENEEFDKLERSIARRRWIYQHHLYAKHVASNAYTKYRPYPTPAQFSASQDLISRTTTFLRRELQVWEALDVEFLTTLIISLMKSIDIRSESAVKLISEFLDMDVPYESGGRQTNAEHFAHEVYCYVRSPYRDLFVYDSVAQYDAPAEVPPPPDIERSRRWRPNSPSLALEGVSSSQEATGPRVWRFRSRSRSSERSSSRSPSGRRFPSTKNRGGNNNTEGSKKGIVGESSQHHANSHRQNFERKYSADERISDRRKGSCDEIPKVVSSSQMHVASSSSKTDRRTTSLIEDRSAKGKHRSCGKEPTINMEPAVSKPSEEGVDEQSEHDNPSAQSTLRANELEHKDGNSFPTPSTHLQRQELRVPRNRSLLDSVRAHLAGNIGVPLAGKYSSASFDQSRKVQEQILLTQESAHLQNNSHANSRVSNGNNPDTQEENIHEGENCISELTTSSNDIFFKSKATPLPSTHGKVVGDTPPLTPVQVPRIGAPRTIPEPCDVMITSENSIADTNSPIFNVISDGSGSASSSYACNDAGQTSGIQFSSEKGLSSMDMDSKQKLGKQQGLSLETQISIIHDAQNYHPHVLSLPARDNIPIRHPTNSKFVTNVFVNQDQSRPHATLNSEEARTRLLARLEFEKKQACLLGHADENPILRADSDRAALRGPALMSSSNAPKERACDRGHRDNDPPFSSSLISEEAAAQEARLRSRTRLRVRLAAEKRLVRGD